MAEESEKEWNVSLLNFFIVEAATKEEAKERAQEVLESLSESNDGLEALANASFSLEEKK